MTLTQHNIQQYRTVVMAIMFAVMALLASPAHASAAVKTAPASKDLMGHILLDAGRHGEAWYVNPQTLQRVSLGRPVAALDKLTANAVAISFDSIARIPETRGADAVAEDFGAAVAGSVLAPNDLLGAPWYVNPTTHLRMRLATPDDAFAVMRTGTPVASRVIDAIEVQADSEARVTVAKAFTKAESADLLDFAAGKVKLLSVDVPANPDIQDAAKALITARIATAKQVLLEKDAKQQAKDGTEQRYVIVDGVNLSQDLVRNGLAFPNIDFPNYRYAEQLIVASIDAKNHQLGFWSPTFQTTHQLAVTAR